MDPITLAALTGVKMFSDARRSDRDNEMRALELQWSPWTRIAPREESRPDGLSTALQAAAAGMSQQNMDQDNAWVKAYKLAELNTNRKNAGIGQVSESDLMNPSPNASWLDQFKATWGIK